jgi:hypothetical protein
VVSKPHELVEAEMVYRLCQAYHALPDPGGVLDQSVGIIRTHAILAESGYFGDLEAGSSSAPSDPFAGIPMEAL